MRRSWLIWSLTVITRNRGPDLPTIGSSAMPCPTRTRTSLSTQHVGIVARCAVINEPLIQQLAVLVRHDRHDVAVAGLAHQRHQTTQLAVVLTEDVHTGMGSSYLDQRAKPIHAASAQILRLVSDLHNIRTEAGDLAEPYENLVAAVA